VIPADIQVRLRALIERDGHIPPNEWATFAASLTERRAARHGHILRRGHVAIWLGFVVEGFLRKYRVHDGRQVNIAFLAAGSSASPVPRCARSPSAIGAGASS
jgi:hypothetical protein